MMRLVNINICDTFTVVVEAEDRCDAERKAREFCDNLTEAFEEAGGYRCIERAFTDRLPNPIHTSRRGLDFEIDCCDQGEIALSAEEEVGYTIVKVDLEQMTNGAPCGPRGSLQGEAELANTGGMIYSTLEEAEYETEGLNGLDNGYFYWAVPVAIKVQ